MDSSGPSNSFRGKRARYPASGGYPQDQRGARFKTPGDTSDVRSIEGAQYFGFEPSVANPKPLRSSYFHVEQNLSAAAGNARITHGAADFQKVSLARSPQIKAGKNDERRPRAVDGRRVDLKRSGIVVIHRRAFFRDCFVRCLEKSYEDHDVFAFESAVEWRNSKNKRVLSPAVVVLFVEDDRSTNIEDLQLIEADAPVVIMSNVDSVNSVTRAFKRGARGYIPTNLSYNVAVEAVRLVVAGGTFVPESSLALDRNSSEASPASALLTERQMKVVEALSRGMANKQIAHELSMSEHTVKVHLRHIMRKLNARNRTEVAVLTRTFL